jgi:hypothetical protein
MISWQRVERDHAAPAEVPTDGYLSIASRSPFRPPPFERRGAMAPGEHGIDFLLDAFEHCVELWAGRAEEGIPLIEQAMRLNPYHPEWYDSSLA